MEKKQSNKNIMVVLAAAAVICVCYMVMITQTTLWDRDEPRFARASVEMIESGNYLFPTFNDEVWADKPVLVYWLMTVSIKMFGSNEFACRFWSALGTGVCSFLIFLIGKRLFGYKQGLIAMGVFATSTLVLVQGTMATSDGALLPFTLGAMAIFTYAITSKVKQYHIISIGVLMGLGALAKGPIGLMPMPVMFLTFWFTRKSFSEFIKNSFLVAEAVVIAGGVFLIWALQANAATDGEFLKTFIGRHVLGRAMKPMEHHGGNFWLYLPYYIPVIIGGFFPWIVFLPGGVSALIGKRIGIDKTRSLLLVWTVSIVAVMSLAATKLPHYIYFTWPALALIASAVITEYEEGKLSKKDINWIKAGFWFFAPIGTIVGLAMIGGAFYIPLEGLMIPCIACGVIMLAMTAAVSYCVFKLRLTKAAVIIIIGMVVFHLPHLGGVMKAAESVKMTPEIGKIINEKSEPSVKVASYKFGMPTLNYYAARKITPLANPEEVKQWLNGDEPAIVVALRSKYDEVVKQYGPLDVVELGTAKGLEYTKGIEEIELIAVMSKK